IIYHLHTLCIPSMHATVYGYGSGDEGVVEEGGVSFEEDSENEEIDPLVHDSPSPSYAPIRHLTPKPSLLQDWSGSRSKLNEADP
ncbi:jg27132, partial [Pararge aegeria aegeria]